MNAAMQLAAIPESTALKMFDEMTAAAIVLPDARKEFDFNVAEIIMVLQVPIRLIINTQYPLKGYIPK